VRPVEDRSVVLDGAELFVEVMALGMVDGCPVSVVSTEERAVSSDGRLADNAVLPVNAERFRTLWRSSSSVYALRYISLYGDTSSLIRRFRSSSLYFGTRWCTMSAAQSLRCSTSQGWTVGSSSS
jgi:hypothetical protein